jgi:molecular chaperone DnaJ
MDYYSVLGVVRTSSAAEIKKSYRKLALEHHPDRNPDDPKAEDKLKGINEAYAVLSDQQKRDSYDRFGMRAQRRTSGPPPGDMAEAFRNMGFNFHATRRGGGPQRGQDISISYPVTLSAAVLGSEARIEMNITDNCSGCTGLGATEFDVCKTCDGQGLEKKVYNGMHVASTCHDCGGMGKFALNVCADCNGRKFVPAKRSLDITIPPGVQHGQRLALRGQGQSGINTGPPGDVYVTVVVVYPSDLTEEEKTFLRGLDAKTK